MEDILIELLSTFDYPVIRQGSLAPSEKYPDTFFTFWNNDTSEHSAYDNETSSETTDFDVNVYSNNVNNTYNLLTSAINLLKNNGWTIYDRGHDVYSDEITHTGRGIGVIYLKDI